MFLHNACAFCRICHLIEWYHENEVLRTIKYNCFYLTSSVFVLSLMMLLTIRFFIFIRILCRNKESQPIYRSIILTVLRFYRWWGWFHSINATAKHDLFDKQCTIWRKKKENYKCLDSLVDIKSNKRHWKLELFSTDLWVISVNLLAKRA